MKRINSVCFVFRYAFESVYVRKSCLTAIPVALFIGMLFEDFLSADPVLVVASSEKTLGNLLFYSFYGASFEASKGDPLPVRWLLILICGCLATFGFAEARTHDRLQYIIRSKARYQLYLSMCVWNIVTTVLYYLIFFSTLCIMILVRSRNFSTGVSAEFITAVSGYKVGVFYKPINAVFSAFYLIIFMCCAINIFQMSVAFCFGSYISFFVSTGMLIAAVFIPSPLLPGNFLMLARSSILEKTGFSTLTGYLVGGIYLLLGFIAGFAVTRKADCIIKTNRGD